MEYSKVNNNYVLVNEPDSNANLHKFVTSI